MLKIDAHSHVGEGAAVWTGQQVVERMDTMGVDKTVIFTTWNVVSGDAVEYRLTCGTALLLYENRRIRT